MNTVDSNLRDLIISIKNIGIKYIVKNNKTEVFDNFSLEVTRGELLAICGSSGVGKSTLLRLIAGLIHPDTGEIFVDGNCVKETTRNMGFVPQSYSKSLLPWLTVKGNVMLPFAGTKNDLSKFEKATLVSDVLQRVGLARNEESYPWQLSGGMQQRVAIARALVASPKILVLDEPFSSLDAFTRGELQDLVLKLSEENELTTIMVTHDADEAVYMADRVIVLKSSPAAIALDLKVELSKPRTQLETRSNANFLRFRNQIYVQLSNR